MKAGIRCPLYGPAGAKRAVPCRRVARVVSCLSTRSLCCVIRATLTKYAHHFPNNMRAVISNCEATDLHRGEFTGAHEPLPFAIVPHGCLILIDSGGEWIERIICHLRFDGVEPSSGYGRGMASDDNLLASTGGVDTDGHLYLLPFHATSRPKICSTPAKNYTEWKEYWTGG